jgi:uncharacterized protein (DUF2235 family)
MDAETPRPDTFDAQNETAKAIVLFSDGTGNSSAKLFKTNVWRMYEAVDLGPPAAGKRYQISYYDDGVGTSAFKPLAVLGGAFGWGLKRNVLDIYRFACRNYRRGDEIYAFGFSRGAFTMRIAIALMATQGLVSSDNEVELLRRSREAYRAFRRDFVPRRLAWPTKAFRHLRDGFNRRFNRTDYDRSHNVDPIIRFVGVWDTVAAYGGPIVEITRAIDNWVFPLSMPNYRLHESVRCARHALAIDDERDAFQPLLWDEVFEQQLVDEKKVSEDRLRQVWFTGMHSDVGGGYPDESLSYVSLLWMMEEAEKADLRTLQTIKDRFVALTSSAGPIHDSRQGIGAYYRYQPRKIAAWTHPVDPATYSLRDPLIRAADGRPQGLLRSVRIHESVIARIASGTDRYAPITLPRDFNIEPPQVEGENVPQPDSEGGLTARSAAKRPRPMISAALHRRLSDQSVMDATSTALEAVWDLVWRRRVAYFVTLALTLLLLSMPLWSDAMWRPPLLDDGRTGWIGGVIRLISLVLPEFAEPWVSTYADNWFYFAILAFATVLVMRYSSSRELELRDRAREIWRQTTTIGGPPCQPVAPTRLQNFRNGLGYQRGVQTLKWEVLPNLIVAPLIALTGLWLLGGALTQVMLSFVESGNHLCESAGENLPEVTVARLHFTPRRSCQAVGAQVIQGQQYTITFEVTEAWWDSSYRTSPIGLSAGDMRWGIGYLGIPFRRVINARYLQPALEIRRPSRMPLFNKEVHIYPLALEQDGDRQGVYRGQFEAKRSGELLVFANDAVLPIDLRYFYERSGGFGDENRGNHGAAWVTVQRTDLPAHASGGGSPDCTDAKHSATMPPPSRH